jgi:hypothetical protein
MQINRLAAVCGLAASAACVSAQVRFNEVAIDVPSTDNGNEFFELKSDVAGYSLSDLTILEIEGDGNNKGLTDQALSLAGQSTGSNKLFLWRDSTVVLEPAPAPETNIFVGDFSPDLENGAKTYLLVRNYTGTRTQDLDTDNDGVIDVTPWSEVVAAIGWGDNDNDGDAVYAAQFGGADLSDPTATGAGFTPDCFALIGSDSFGFDVIGAAPGPWTNDPAETVSFPTPGLALPPDFVLTPGSENPGGGNPCLAADFNGDNQVDFFDYLDFVQAFDNEADSADFNGDNQVDFFDYLDFASAFDSAC